MPDSVAIAHDQFRTFVGFLATDASGRSELCHWDIVDTVICLGFLLLGVSFLSGGMPLVGGSFLVYGVLISAVHVQDMHQRGCLATV